MSDIPLDENTLPEGTEEFVNVVPEDAEDVDLAKDQEPVLDDEPVEDVVDDDDQPTDGPATEGA